MNKALLTLLACTLLLTACDPGYDEYCLLRNEASQPLTVIPAGYHCMRNDTNEAFDTFYYQPLTLAMASDSMVVLNGGIGSACQEAAYNSMCSFFDDSVIFRFDDGCQTVYHAADTLGISPYNPSAPGYRWEEKVGEPYAGHVYFGQLTFTINDEHHPQH